MKTILVIAILILCIMVVVSLVRGIIAFLQTTKLDLQSGDTENMVAMQLKQNKAMMNRIKYQGLAIVAVAILLMISGPR